MLAEYCKILGNSQKLSLNISFLNSSRMFHFNFSNTKISSDKCCKKRLCQKYDTISFHLQKKAHNRITHLKMDPYLWAGILNHRPL